MMLEKRYFSIIRMEGQWDTFLNIKDNNTKFVLSIAFISKSMYFYIKMKQNELLIFKDTLALLICFNINQVKVIFLTLTKQI